MIERYAVYWVDLGPAQGSELQKTRPAVVISDAEMNRHLETVVVCPMTSRLHPRWPSRVQAEVEGRRAEIAVDQIRTVSRRRIGARLDSIDEDAAAALRHVITEMYGVLSVSEG
jgi:mRNA interferase MazF